MARRENARLKKELDAARSGGKNKGPDGRYFTARGGLSMALKRNLSNTPCSTMGIGLETNVHPSTVSRWELKLDGALRASSKQFYKDADANLQVQGGIAVHGIRTDSTNARVWHQHKLHVAEIISTYQLNGYTEPLDTCYLGDLLCVYDASGLACRSMVLQQLTSMGCPTWVESIDKLGRAPCGAGMTLPQRLKAQLRAHKDQGLERAHQMYVQTSDAGSEQLWLRRRVAIECADSLWVWAFAGNCLYHQSHIIYKCSLKVSEWALSKLDSLVGYYASLCKVANVRENGSARRQWTGIVSD